MIAYYEQRSHESEIRNDDEWWEEEEEEVSKYKCRKIVFAFMMMSCWQSMNDEEISWLFQAYENTIDVGLRQNFTEHSLSSQNNESKLSSSSALLSYKLHFTIKRLSNPNVNKMVLYTI